MSPPASKVATAARAAKKAPAMKDPAGGDDLSSSDEAEPNDSSDSDDDVLLLGSAPGLGQWSCSTCTFKDWNHTHTKCEVCAAPRRQEGPARRLEPAPPATDPPPPYSAAVPQSQVSTCRACSNLPGTKTCKRCAAGRMLPDSDNMAFPAAAAFPATPPVPDGVAAGASTQATCRCL